ncbi:hypothetical protein WME76_12515 [Sorangium sp. So ce119]|uniref:hypothetical protein n=1 Tax=Sorangium sp. So ce119 TaxID=3133279 RepID=UPI003F5E92BE
MNDASRRARSRHFGSPRHTSSRSAPASFTYALGPVGLCIEGLDLDSLVTLNTLVGLSALATQSPSTGTECFLRRLGGRTAPVVRLDPWNIVHGVVAARIGTTKRAPQLAWAWGARLPFVHAGP